MLRADQQAHPFQVRRGANLQGGEAVKQRRLHQPRQVLARLGQDYMPHGSEVEQFRAVLQKSSARMVIALHEAAHEASPLNQAAQRPDPGQLVSAQQFVLAPVQLRSPPWSRPARGQLDLQADELGASG